VAAFGMTGCGALVGNGPQQLYENLTDSAATPAATGALARGTYTVIVTGTANVFTNSQSNTTV
jgi:roadblock/LC7 domain-containing protein